MQKDRRKKERKLEVKKMKIYVEREKARKKNEK